MRERLPTADAWLLVGRGGLVLAALLVPSACTLMLHEVREADAGSDADADGDLDGDSDSDLDADGDADTDVDSDADVDADTDVDLDADTDTDPDSDGGTGWLISVSPDDWQLFNEPLASCAGCEAPCSCVTGDVIDDAVAHDPDAAFSEPDSSCVYQVNGYCGTGGLRQQVSLPPARVVTLESWVWTDYLDSGGGAGIYITDGAARSPVREWLWAQATLDWELASVDVSAHAGRTVWLEVAVRDMDTTWCANYDHNRVICADDIVIRGEP